MVQFGEGNFLRGFVDWIIDILNEKTDFNGAVEIVQPRDKTAYQKVNAQDGLFHVVTEGLQDGQTVQETRLVSCVSNALSPYADYAAYLKLAQNPALEFVISNTTEAGITFDPADTTFETTPTSFPGKLTALLYRRFTHFNGAKEKALTIIPCELIEQNGDQLRQIVLRYADLWHLPAGFSAWVEQDTIFCNTLVDRIVPGFPKDTSQQIQQKLGFEDNLLVKSEPFHLFMMEAPASVAKAFPAEQAGLQVKIVADLTPYRIRKVRILNGAHSALVPVAYLQGLRTVREAVEDEEAGAFIRETIFEEIIPTLDLSAQELQQFANDVIERFQNPFIHHELLSIALNSVSKFKVRVLPSILEYHRRKGQLPTRLLKSLAALILFYKGDYNGEQIPLNDAPEVLAFFQSAWQKETPGETVQAVLANQDFWGADLTQVEGLQAAMTTQLKTLQQKEQAKTV